MSLMCSLPSLSGCPMTCLPYRYPWWYPPHNPLSAVDALTCSRLNLFPQMAIIVLAILLFLAAMLFILMNWYYRTM